MIRLIQRRLIIPRGDTGSFTVPLIAAANSGDAAVFTIFSLATHKKIFTKVVTIKEDPITIDFSHGDTVNLPVGRYVWDIKYYRNPVIENEVLINGDEITSYYAAFELPICEIRETGDVLLTADNAPTSLVSPEYLNIIDAALSHVNASKTAAETAATSAQAAAETAEQSVNELKNLSTTATTLESNQEATASYNFDTGILTLGIPRGEVGNGVSSVLLNNDYTLTLNFTDGTSTTVGPIRGEKGDTGEIPTEWKDELDSVAADVENLATVANTGSYNDLSNKPFIPTRVSDLTDDSGHYTKPSGGIPASDLAETYLTEHQDISGKANIADLATVATTGSYNDLSNKPTIPIKVSDLTNDAGYISGYTETDPTVPAWAKAAQKPSYTAAEVGATTEQQVSSMIASAIGDIHSFDMAVVQTLPTENISNHTIYLVPKTGETNDVYDEYIYVNDAWEMVGNTQIDLSNYVQKTDYATENTPGIIKIGGALKQSSSGDGILLVVPADDRMLKTSVNANFPITPSIQHASTFYGLAKAAGDYTQSYSTNTVGTYTAAAKTAIRNMIGAAASSDIPSVPVTDVQVDGSSILNNGTANIPLASESEPGVVKINSSLGITQAVTYDSSTQTSVYELAITPASLEEIKAGRSLSKPIGPRHQHEATFYGLAKAAGDTTQTSSDNAVGTYTNEAKAAIRTMIGAAASADVGVQDVQVDGTSIVTSGIANVPIATEQTLGVVKTKGMGNGLALLPDGTIYVWRAQSPQIKAGGNQYNPIMPAYQHEATFYGLAKVAGVDMKDSDNAIGTYTDAAKGAIQKMLGVTDLFGNEENGITASRAYAAGEAFVSNGKLYRATAAIAQDGAIVTDGSGANCVEISVTEDFIKRTDYATSSTAGVVKVNSDYGIRLNENNVLRTSGAQENHIQGGVNTYLPITPYHQHEAVYFGLAKAAGVDLKNESLYTWSSPMNYTDTAKAAINNMIGSTSKAALENAGITGYTYSEKLGGQFSVTTKTTSGYSYPYARASVTGRFSKHYRHRVTVNGTVYDLKTRLWFVPGKVYEYLGNLNLYVSDISGVPGGTDDVPFVIISDLNDSSSIDVITQTAGTYTIFIEQITPTKKVLPKSLIWDDEYVPIEKKNNGGTYNGFSIGVNELKNTRATFAAGYNNSINGEFSEVIGFSNINNGSTSAIVGFGNTSSGAGSHVFGYNNTNTTLNATIVGSMNNNSGITAFIIGLGNTNQGHQNTLIGTLNQTSSDALNSTLIGNGLLSGSKGTTVVGSGNVLSTNKTYTNWAGNTHYQVGDCVYNTTDYKYYQCLEENTDATFTASKWKKLPYISNACFIVGNGKGNNDERSNALSIDWDGNAKFGGNVYVNCAIDSTGGNKLISEVDYATSSTAGVVKVSADQGIRLTDDGVLCIQRADNAMIKAGENFYQPVTSLNVYAAAFYGLAKAAGDTTQSSSSNAVGTYTAEAKGAIRAMLDVDDSIVEEYINSTSPSITAGPNCRYICGEVTSVSFTPCASGSCELMFTSGSTLAVLTLPSTVKMPEWFEVETNTIYDIIITNGVYGAVMSWPL